jgi:S1-C subfamily serine protease
MLHTGLHDDYHRPSDKAEKINATGLRQVSQLMFRTALDLADEVSRPKFRTAARSESPSEQANAERLEPPAPGRLGLSWDEARAKKEGVVQIISVTAESAAAKAGLKVGDRIVGYAGRPLEDAEQFRMLVMATRGSVPLKIERKGSEQPIELTVRPAGEPVKLGIAWRVDDAEPGAVLLVRVAPGSPADRAGLRIYDRLYEVNGRRFSTSDEFRELANSLPGPVEFLVETQGKTRNVFVELLETVTDLQTQTPPIPATAQR